jgi:hypothetical protein
MVATRTRHWGARSRRVCIFVVLALALIWPLYLQNTAPVSGASMNSGTLATSRFGQTATLLTDGRVLVAGGRHCENGICFPVASAEIYSPTAGTWNSAGNMTVPRVGHTATLLPDGMVLVAGGENSAGTALASADLYDPAANTWTPTGDMIDARAGHTATLLASGQVLVAGGGTVSGELYDPTTGTWSVTGAMAVARSGDTATLLDTGEVLVAGGDTPDFGAPSTAELYDPATGTWSMTGSMTTYRAFHTATLLRSGRVLVAGGFISVDDNEDATSTAELYDPASGTWSTTANMLDSRVGHTATLLPTGDVLVIGGANASDVCSLQSAEQYSPETGSWSRTDSIKVPRSNHTATLLLNGEVLVAAGLDNCFNGFSLASTEVYSPIPLQLLHDQTFPSGFDLMSGSGFGPNETVHLLWDAPDGLVLGSTMTDASGSFGGTTAIPFHIPDAPAGHYLLYVEGPASGTQAFTDFDVVPNLRVTPTGGPHDSSITITGRGYGANEPVIVRFNCVIEPESQCTSPDVLGTPTTDEDGAFQVTVNVPSDAPPGVTEIGGKGAQTRLYADAEFTVMSP